LPSQV
jgi:hypothetical protein